MNERARSNQQSERLEARVSLEQKKLFKRAAKISGRSLTSFILMALQEAALQVLRDHEVIKLSTQDQAAFVKALLAPPKPSKKLILAAERYKKNVVSR